LQDCVISLPIHTELTTEELTYITTNFLQVVDQLAK
jgi:UDP-2-acetamido-2-deoxy-ribo-hexuluronate aminotransferase